MNSDLFTFLNCIQDAPADPAPRLIFADWLEERGDPRAQAVREATLGEWTEVGYLFLPEFVEVMPDCMREVSEGIQRTVVAMTQAAQDGVDALALAFASFADMFKKRSRPLPPPTA